MIGVAAIYACWIYPDPKSMCQAKTCWNTFTTVADSMSGGVLGKKTSCMGLLGGPFRPGHWVCLGSMPQLLHI